MAAEEQIRVLLVEDSLTQAIQTQAELDKTGTTEVDHATSLAEARKSLQEQSYDVVLLDLTLPDSAGLATLSAVCAAAPDRPVVVLTSQDDDATAFEALEVGAQDYLVKGRIDPDLLSRAFRYAIHRKKGEVDLLDANRQLEKRIREIDCLYGISSILDRPDVPLDRALADAIEGIPAALDHPDVAVARIRCPDCLGGEGVATPLFRETEWQLSAPIRVDGETLGRVEAGYLEPCPEADVGPFLESERHLIDEVARRVGQAIERVRHQQELHRMAITDPLTGAANRRRFMEVAEAERQRAGRYQRPLSVMMLDIDHFKRINDVYGHSAGDLVLKEVVRASQELLREQDLFGRLGGEEFAVLLPETDLEEARNVAERLRARVEALKVDTDRGTVPVTLSGGVTECALGAGSLDLDLGRADAALYRAKNGGRNRIAAA